MNNRRVARTTLIALLALGAVSAVAGAIGLLADLLAMDQDVLDGSPFDSFTVPALILGCIVGGSQLSGLVAMRRFGDRGIVVAGAAGCIMAGWIVGEVLLLGSDPGAMRNLQVVYFALGLIQVLLAIHLMQRAGRLA